MQWKVYYNLNVCKSQRYENNRQKKSYEMFLSKSAQVLFKWNNRNDLTMNFKLFINGSLMKHNKGLKNENTYMHNEHTMH